KALKHLGDKVDAEDSAKVESAASDLKGGLKGDDKDIIEKKAAALAEASAKVAQQAYASQAGADAGAAGGPAGGAGGASGDGGREEVLDAEFEEVDKDKGRKG
ncbi:MAG: dnaK, partial [Steroidobacteraceae bacterium]|nr:dnaK [Steroidobacteraceae bacterium]